MADRINNLFEKLRKLYGTPTGQWELWCKRPKTIKERGEVIIGAVLAQQTNWKNVELAVKNLKSAGFDNLEKIYKLGIENPPKLKKLIQASGFYNKKFKYLMNVSEFFYSLFARMGDRRKGGFSKPKMTLNQLRQKILKIHGVGRETADSILLYALDRPIFVIDEYTRRFVKKEKITRDFSYNALQNFFESRLREDYRLYQDFHALIVIDGQRK